MPFMRKFWKPKQSIPTTTTLPAVASPTHPSGPRPPAEPLTDSVGRHLDQPSALFTSPPFVNDTDIQPSIQPTKLAAAFGALSEAYNLCSDTILDTEQEEIQEQVLISVLRQVEDRLRRLRSEVLQAVADRPSLLEKKMKDGRKMTYQERIRSELEKVQESYKAGLERSGVSASIEV